jgi:predicted XRE-type DNA-binding protein
VTVCYIARHMATGHATHQTRLHHTIQSAGLTQRQVAAQINKPEATVNRWAKGTVPRKEHRDLIVTGLRALGVEVTAAELWTEDE